MVSSKRLRRLGKIWRNSFERRKNGKDNKWHEHVGEAENHSEVGEHQLEGALYDSDPLQETI
jgi:hypothetical protein